MCVCNMYNVNYVRWRNLRLTHVILYELFLLRIFYYNINILSLIINRCYEYNNIF